MSTSVGTYSTIRNNKDYHKNTSREVRLVFVSVDCDNNWEIIKFVSCNNSGVHVGGLEGRG